MGGANEATMWKDTRKRHFGSLAICFANVNSEVGLELLQAQNWTKQM